MERYVIQLIEDLQAAQTLYFEYYDDKRFTGIGFVSVFGKNVD
jgi:hypothetical protein